MNKHKTESLIFSFLLGNVISLLVGMVLWDDSYEWREKGWMLAPLIFVITGGIYFFVSRIHRD